MQNVTNLHGAASERSFVGCVVSGGDTARDLTSNGVEGERCRRAACPMRTDFRHGCVRSAAEYAIKALKAAKGER